MLFLWIVMPWRGSEPLYPRAIALTWRACVLKRLLKGARPGSRARQQAEGRRCLDARAGRRPRARLRRHRWRARAEPRLELSRFAAARGFVRGLEGRRRRGARRSRALAGRGDARAIRRLQRARPAAHGGSPRRRLRVRGSCAPRARARKARRDLPHPFCPPRVSLFRGRTCCSGPRPCAEGAAPSKRRSHGTRPSSARRSRTRCRRR